MHICLESALWDMETCKLDKDELSERDLRRIHFLGSDKLTFKTASSHIIAA